MLMNTRSILYPSIVIVVTLFLLVPLIFFGLDLTDSGYSTTIAWTQALHPAAADWNINTFGTPLLAGLWFKLTGNTSVLGFRFFWVLTMLAAMLAGYNILSRFYDAKRIAFVLVPTLILAVFNSEEVIVPEYHNFPPVLCLISATFFFATFGKGSVLQIRALALIAGFVAAFATLARLPMFGWLLFMLGTLVLSIIWGEDRQITIRRGLWLVIGFVLGVGASLVLLSASGFSLSWIWAETVDSQRANIEFMRSANPALGYMPLWKSTAIRYGKIIGMGSIALALAFVWCWVKWRVGERLSGSHTKILEGVFLIGFATLIVNIVLNGAAGFLGFHYGPITSILLGAPLLAIVYLFVADFKTISFEKRVLFLSALAFFVLGSLGGSGVWVSTFRHGVWLLLPVVLLETETVVSQHVDFALLRSLVIVGVVALGITLRIEMPYRDKPVYQCLSSFQHPSLAGIHSSAGRVEAVDGLLAAMQQRGIQPNDTIQSYPDGALIYFLTKTIPWYQDSWIGMQWTSAEDLRRTASTLTSQPLEGRNVFPRWVVRVKFDPNSAPSLDAGQPVVSYVVGSNTLYYGFLQQPASRFLDSLWDIHGYTVAWQNNGFALLQRP